MLNRIYLILFLVFIFSCDNSIIPNGSKKDNFDLSSIYGKWERVRTDTHQQVKRIVSITNGNIDSTHIWYDTSYIKWRIGDDGYNYVYEFSDSLVPSGNFEGWHHTDCYYFDYSSNPSFNDTSYSLRTYSFKIDGNYFLGYSFSDTTERYEYHTVQESNNDILVNVFKEVTTEVVLVEDTLKFIKRMSDFVKGVRIEFEMSTRVYARLPEENFPPENWPDHFND